jgi:hypothetical protein
MAPVLIQNVGQVRCAVVSRAVLRGSVAASQRRPPPLCYPSVLRVLRDAVAAVWLAYQVLVAGLAIIAITTAAIWLAAGLAGLRLP